MVSITVACAAPVSADVINSHPAMFYHYEPLMDFGIRRARDPPLSDRAVENLNHLMHCDYSKMGKSTGSFTVETPITLVSMLLLDL